MGLVAGSLDLGPVFSLSLPVFAPAPLVMTGRHKKGNNKKGQYIGS